MPSAIVIVNPVAGSGRAARAAADLRAAVAEAGAEQAESSGPGDVERIASRAAERGIPRIIAVGGEGTIQEVVNGLRGADGTAVVGIVPGGNGNDLARALGLPGEPLAALAVALHGGARRIDAGLLRSAGRERRFVAAGGMGFDAAVAARMAGPRAWWQRGRAGYLLTTVDELRRHRNVDLRVEVDGAPLSLRGPVLFAAFANGAYYGGGMRIAPAAELDDGRLDLCLVGDLSRLEALRQLPGLYRGAHVGHPRVAFHRFRHLRLAGGDAPVHLDGEPAGTLPIEVEVEPGALLVAAPGGSSTVVP
jgi:diacylglycerol kinase (ATP)